MRDAFAIVLHSHLPYARGAGRWPHGEEWIHEAILGTYLPLLVALHDLRAENVPFQLTLGLTPVLVEQLADHDIDVRFQHYVDDQIARAALDARDFAGAGAHGRAGLATFYATRYAALREAYLRRFGRDVVGAFVDLVRSGNLEILTSAATHGYLPLLDEASVHAQLAVGLRSAQQRLGQAPTGIWLPECAYRPGLERILEAHGFTHFFTDANLLSGAPVRAARRRFRVDRAAAWSWSGSADVAVAEPEVGAPARGRGPALVATEGVRGTADLFQPYLVADSRVAAIARHPEVSGQVWSAQSGYPGDPAYREFHRKDDRSGIRYWRVSGRDVDLGYKHDYDVDAAAARVRAHATHFAGIVRDAFAEHRRTTGREGLLTTTFDSELFGHWWFEGVDWLAAVLRELGAGTTTIASRLRADPPRERLALREGSWGKNNDHSTWVNADTSWMWDELRRMRAVLEPLRAAPPADAFRARASRQAVRELLLAQSSDWPFLRTTGQAADYAVERFRGHALRFGRAIELATRGDPMRDEVELRSLERTDNPFPDADLAAFEAATP